MPVSKTRLLVAHVPGAGRISSLKARLAKLGEFGVAKSQARHPASGSASKRDLDAFLDAAAFVKQKQATATKPGKTTSSEPPVWRNAKLRSTANPSPLVVCRMIANNKAQYGHRLFPGSLRKTPGNPQGLGGMDQLRQCLRAVHGYERASEHADIAKCSNGSPLAKLLKGETIYMWRDKSETQFSTTKPSNGKFLELDGAKVVAAQKDVQMWVDSNVADQDLAEILALKSGKRSNISVERRKDLEKNAEGIVMRSKIFMTHKPTGELRDAPEEHIIYHACYPRLNNGSDDQLYFASGPAGAAVLREDRLDELKERYKQVILRQLKVASANGEDIDLQAPNAFLYGLAGPEQKKAKQLFQQALYEAAREAKGNAQVFGGLKAIYVHGTADGIPDDLKDFVFDNTGDAFSPDRIGQENGGRRVAACIMSDALGKVGNGALGTRAERAMEENVARGSSGTVEASGPAFNENCSKDENRRSFSNAVAKVA